MRYKKRKLHKLHSIPIGLCNNKYLVSYSIPLSCMVVLLLMSIISVITLSAHNDVAGAVSQDAGNSSKEGNAVKLVISGADQDDATEVGAGQIAYRRQLVTVELDNVSEYFLSFYGKDTLTPPSGGTAVIGAGADGMLGKDLAPGTWGYAWDYTGSINDEDMYYKTLPANNAELDKPEIVNGSVNFTGKLNFAANFPSNTTLGNYTSRATLTLIVTPKANTGVVNLWRNAAGELTAVDVGTDELQGVDSNFCSNSVGAGWTISLKDNRDQQLYNIVKTNNGDCWFAENLRLTGPRLLASGDSDLLDGMVWEMPGNQVNSAGANAWENNGNNVSMVRNGDTVGGAWKNGYGNYYSWCAATAGTCMEDGEAIKNKEASSSICPKGWKLPTTRGDGSFSGLVTAYKSAWLSNQTINEMAGVSGYRLGVGSNSFWPAAGRIVSSGLDMEGSFGTYWSRNAYTDTSNAYYMLLSNANAYTAYNTGRYYGHSVRCVYDKERVGVWKNNASGGEFDSGLRFMQDITKSNFTNKYCLRQSDGSVSVNATIRLRDIRDKKVYKIVKLRDGNCWMQENLALDGGAKVTPIDSDVDNAWTLPDDANSWQSGQSYYYDIAQMKNGSTVYINSLNPGDGKGWQPGYGNYYSWCAATAGTCLKNSVAITEGNASGSICPKGWKIPTGDVDGQYDILLRGLSSAATIAAPYNFFYTGFIYQDNSGYSREPMVVHPGTQGFYWSRTSASGNWGAYTFTPSAVASPGANTSNRDGGYPVRCIAEPEE